jgi:hypothetical protein
MAIGESIAARVSAMVAETQQPTGGAPASGSDSASEVEVSAPPAGQASEVESGSVAAEGAAEPDTRATKLALLEEKLASRRERRKAERLEDRAREERKQAETDRKAAAEERAKWEALKTGNFKDAAIAMGRDPRQMFDEMQEEARIAGTPEAQMQRMQAMFEKQLADVTGPLKQTIEEMQREKQELLIREENTRFASEFTRAIQDPGYAGLREEYDDQQLYTFARTVKHDLTQAGKRFTILDVLAVLKTAQDEHDAKRQARRTRLQTATQSPAVQAASEKPTVNGTAERRNAGTTLGNDLASSRASGDRSRTHTTRAERIRKLIEGAD